MPKNPLTITTPHHNTSIEVLGARVHNLKNIDLTIPRNQLVIFTGVSGSGKSSLAFDTIYAEGQRRYIETFANYARPFMGELERPDVDKVNGLSPVISIEQKTTSRNPRSTVGTVTEIYDYLRVLYAKVADAYSYMNGEKMVKQTEEQIEHTLLEDFKEKEITIFAPLVKRRKGHYRELFEQIKAKGFKKVRVDGYLEELHFKMQLDRYRAHTIELLVDQLVVSPETKEQLQKSLSIALSHGKKSVIIQEKSTGKLHYFSQALTDPLTGLSYEEPVANHFSFNSPLGACPVCEGLGSLTELTFTKLIPDPTLNIAEGGILIIDPDDTSLLTKITELFAAYQIPIQTPINKLPNKLLHILFYGNTGQQGADGYKKVPSFAGLVPNFQPMKVKKNDDLAHELPLLECPKCHGNRLNKVALQFKLGGKDIGQLSQMTLARLYDFFDNLFPQLESLKQQIAEEPIQEIQKRIKFLLAVGLDYLFLHRPLATLSGGEAQRIRLATQVGTQLVGVLYILDEPSIGLHQRDNNRLIQTLRNLRDIGNSILVVEHDKEMILAADHVVEIGPGAGKNGGNVVAQGPLDDFLLQPSVTADFLNNVRTISIPDQPRLGHGTYLRLSGCTGHNLKNVTLNLPLGKFICLTGVSGSGKSTLVHRTLYPLLQRHLYKSHTLPLPYQAIEGLEHIDHIIGIDQRPIGRTPRSNPSTYTNVFSAIRNLFAQLPGAKIMNYQPGRFSFNVPGGRCETCQGAGLRVIEMNFLPDVYVQCETCQGKRYNRETLAIHYKGKTIGDVLDMTVSYAVSFFEKYPQIRKTLQVLEEVGLGYLTLGQSATTLSGGEAQRIKLATELAKRSTGNTLYILDEPTTGLHFQDIAHLLHIIQRLTDQGNTVLVIEHNLDVVKTCDHMIDMGPEGGEAGGYIVAEGTPQEVSQHPESHTGFFLKQIL